MKNKVLKIGVILVVILSMTMTNFIFVGSSLISYAVDNTITNHKNVEFKAYFKDKEGRETTTLEKEEKEEEAFLYLYVNIKREGYFNGKITIADGSNFISKEVDSSYVNKVENNTIYLNQMNVGTAEEIKVKIEPIQEENYELGLLNVKSKIGINGIYRDSTQRDIAIRAEREVALQLVENNTPETMINEMKVITNKIMNIEGQEKRVLQLSYELGLQENNYPIQEIYSKIVLPAMDTREAKIENIEYLNNMQTADIKSNGNRVEISLKNEANADGKVMWKSQGTESVILTCLYDPEVTIENNEIQTYERIMLYNGKEIETQKAVIVGEEEIDSTIEVNAKEVEGVIYKGKLNAGIDRPYESITQIKVNLATAIDKIEISEENHQYMIQDRQEEANVTYHGITIKKEQFNKILGEDGKITIYDQEGEIIGVINNTMPSDEQGNINIYYEKENITRTNLRTTKPIEEGTIEIIHRKAIHTEGKTTQIQEASELRHEVKVNEKNAQTSIKLENTITKAELEMNKEALSTIVANNIELRAILTSNHEKYDLYNNPQINIELPEQVEKITISNINILYEDELKVRDYNVRGRNIQISLEGEQTQYKEEAIEGATIVINAVVEVNHKVATQEKEIKMTYQNEEITNTIATPIKIVAPTDMTTIYSMEELGVETLGEEETKQVQIPRGVEEKELEAQIEIINNNENDTENVKILGDFPTDPNNNNMGIEISKGITLQGAENAKIYYSVNEKATDEIEKTENQWTENMEDGAKVSKYLIMMDQLETGNSIEGTYNYKIPANLEYNQMAKTSYQLKYTNSNTKVENKIASTEIEAQTGIGPNLETKLTAMVGGSKSNKPVKNGEVIQYQIEITNNGSEEISGIMVTGQVPEGTTMVQPEENYEYTGPSYYQEVEDKTYQATIEKLEVGKTIYQTYEVRVNNQTAEGTTLTNQAEVKYGDITKQTEEIKNVTANGNLRVTTKRVTDKSVDLYLMGSVKYNVMIENISNQKQENVKVQANIPEGAEIERVSLFTGDISSPDKIKEEAIEGKTDEINIGTLEAGEVKTLKYAIVIKKVPEGGEMNFWVMAKKGNEEYQSNNWKDNVHNINIGISMTANTQTQYLEADDVLEYTIVVENREKVKTKGLMLKDTIPQELSIDKITKDDEEIREIEGNDISLPLEIEGNETTMIKIQTVVDDTEDREGAEPITNNASVELYGETIATTSAINHVIKPNEEDPEENEENENKNENDIKDNDIAKGTKTIAGVAWFDENANGQREQGEKLLSNVKVRLLNTDTKHLVRKENGEVLEATTNENGVYLLDKLGNGEYIAIFDYDTTKYTLTKYRANGVSEVENSNVVRSELLIEDERKQVAATNLLKIQDNDISDINVGLIELENFDLKLDKYVNKIIIQNAKGTTVKEYNNQTMAKVELDSKTINGSTVIIEYQIKVTNVGEIEGYAKKIADYATKDLKFSSELNKDWYQVGDTLYTTSFANEKIKPGESKIVTLTLTKAMTDNNTGLMPNIAEIAEDYNELGIEDSNSTPGNRAKGENDMGSADVLLSVRTGGVVYVTIGIVILVMLTITATIMIKKRKIETKE